MDFGDGVSWVEKNPLLTGVVVIVGGLGLLYILGFFSSSATASNTGDPGAAAYYSAEEAQAAIGGQEQIATTQTAAQTAQDQIAATAATTIDAQDNDATTAQTSLLTALQGNEATLQTQLGSQAISAAASVSANATDVAAGVAAYNTEEGASLQSTEDAQNYSLGSQQIQLGATQTNDAFLASLAQTAGQFNVLSMLSGVTTAANPGNVVLAIPSFLAPGNATSTVGGQ